MIGLVAKAQFVRPTSEGHDSATVLVEQGQGRYVVVIALPLGGQWELAVTATRGDLNYQFAQRIYLP